MILKVWDIEGGERSEEVARSPSFQMTDTGLRTEDGREVLYLNFTTSAWVVKETGTEWYDFTISEEPR